LYYILFLYNYIRYQAKIFILLVNSIRKYIKKLLGIPSYILKRVVCLICVCLDLKSTHVLLEKFNNKRSELKYLSNFRKRNQTRFYD